MALNELSFDAPIPGSSLTAEPRSRPWLNPPQYSSVNETIEYYVDLITSDEAAKNALKTMEVGIPLTSIANILITGSVMQGKHSVDVGILAMPSIIETLRLIGDSAGIDYETGLDEKSEDKLEDSDVSYAVQKLMDEAEDSEDDIEDDDYMSSMSQLMPEPEPNETVEEPQEEMVMEEPSPEPSGLMSRR